MPRTYRLGSWEGGRGTAPSAAELAALVRAEALDLSSTALLLIFHAPADGLGPLLSVLADADGSLGPTLATEGSGPVCGRVFRRGDLVWTCGRCGKDGTCVQCDACFRASDHDGHDVHFHLSDGGAGCCDCGDEEAWSPRGCCPLHAAKPVPPPDAGSLPSSLRYSLAAVASSVVAAAVSHSTDSARGHSDLEDHPLLRDGAATTAVSRLHNDDVHSFDEVTSALEACGIARGDALTGQASRRQSLSR